MSTVQWVYQSEHKPNLCLVDGGGEWEFVGVVRGADYPQITYQGPTRETVLSGLELSEWIYKVRKVVNR